MINYSFYSPMINTISITAHKNHPDIKIEVKNKKAQPSLSIENCWVRGLKSKSKRNYPQQRLIRCFFLPPKKQDKMLEI